AAEGRRRRLDGGARTLWARSDLDRAGDPLLEQATRGERAERREHVEQLARGLPAILGPWPEELVDREGERARHVGSERQERRVLAELHVAERVEIGRSVV